MGRNITTRGSLRRLRPGLGALAAAVGIALALGGATAVAAQAAVTIAIPPEADTYVSAMDPTTNFGNADFFDTYGGFSSSCVPYSSPAYGLLRFDLSSIPPGTVVSDARIVTTTRAGYAQDGDSNHHAIFLPDDSWSETGVTWDTRPADGTVAPGDPTLTGGGDIRTAPGALGSDFMFRAACSADPDPAGDQTHVFPTNGFDAAKPLAVARADMIDRVTTERAGDGKLSIELYSANCPVCSAGANTSYWARYRSRESTDAAARPYLEVTLGPDNDAWTRAAPIAPAGHATGSIDISGQARWYRFAIQPGTRAHVDLTNVPANYDVTLFTDIAQAFNTITSPADLQRLSAEFAADAFSPSVFSPSVFSPSVFSPSVFSPSVFSPSVFSPSVFSPSVFSPSVFSPSVFSPSVFSPSVFSPSVFSPSVFSGGQAYESAQVRSLIAVSANDGNADEHITADTWNNTGQFYVRVAGRNGTFSPAAPFDVDVQVDPSSCTGVVPSAAALLSAPPQTGVQSLILADYGRMAGSLTTMQARLASLETAVSGRVLNLSAVSPRVAALHVQADANQACPYAKNLVADAIRDVVLAYRTANPALSSVVVVGSDHVVPFFRYPDTAGLGPESGYVPPVLGTTASQAALRLNYFLSQDAYGSKTEIQAKGVSLPVPDLPVGRLVETPAEITGMIDAFLADTVLEPTTSLVTGYDFLADGATSVQSTMSAGLGGSGAESLITNQDVDPSVTGAPPLASWTADRLRTSLLGSRHDLVYLAGHFSANNLLAADYATTLNASELAASSVNLTGSVVFSAGCHAGYSIVDGDAVPNATQPLDWIQAFAQKRATLIAGTGYQYGDTDFLEYSERLYRDFAQSFRFGTGAVSVGGALVSAKQRYLTDTATLGGIHQKAVLEATLYGLPMFAVNMPAGRNFVLPTGPPIVSATTPVATNPGSTLGLSFANVTRTPALSPFTRALLTGTGTASGVTARWWAGPSGVVTNPGAPTVPLEISDVSVAGKVLRGVGFRGGTFSDLAGVTPFTGAPATELNSVHSPFVSEAFFPSKIWNVNYFGGLQGAAASTKLLLTPVQYRSDATGSLTDLQRTFSSTSLRLFYSGYTTSFGGNSAALAAPPTIARVEASVSGSDVVFRVQAVGEPAAGMQGVWVTYTGAAAGQWQSLDLTQDSADSTLWTGALTGVTPGQIEFIVQAVNGVGLVGLDDNQGAYYRPGQIPAALQAPGLLTATSLALAAPVSGTYGGAVSLSATLTGGATPLQGQTVRFSLGGSETTAVTNASGVATVSLPILASPGGGYDVTAAFDGTTTLDSSTASQPFTITKRPTSLTLGASVAAPTVGGETGVSATLATTGGVGITDHTVIFVLTPASGPAISAARVTGAGGKAQLGIVPLAPGSYTVKAYFGPNAALGFAVPDDTIYDPSSATLAGPLAVGRKVLFASARTGNGDIYVVDPAGGAQVQITSGSPIDAEPEWSPGGDKIVFSSTRGGNLEIYVMNADGSGVTRLTTNSAIDTSPAWSPNGQKIAFASNRGSGNNWDIYVMNADGSGVARLTTHSDADTSPAWSPDSTQIAFTSARTGGGDIYTMNADGTLQTRRTTSTGLDTEPAWSGTSIAFSTNRHGSSNFEIYRMTQTGTGETRLTNLAGHDITPAWSSDGQKIVFATNRAPGTGLNFNIYTMNANGSSQTALVTHASADVFPDW